jgi:hypothetical protein
MWNRKRIMLLLAAVVLVAGVRRLKKAFTPQTQQLARQFVEMMPAT